MVDSDPREAGDWDPGLQVSGLASRVAEAGPEGTTSVLAPGSWETVTQSQETADPEGHRLPSSESRVRVITSCPSSSGTRRPQPQTASILQLPFRSTKPHEGFYLSQIISTSNPFSPILLFLQTQRNNEGSYHIIKNIHSFSDLTLFPQIRCL